MVRCMHNDAYAGQAIDGSNEHGCPYIGQTVATAVRAESLALVASSLNLTVEELLALLTPDPQL